MSRTITAALLACFVGMSALAGTAPGLRVHLLAAPSDPRHVTAPGRETTLMIAVGNVNGKTDAQDTVLSVTLPTGMSFESAGRKPDAIEGRDVRWNLGTLKAGEPPHLFELSARIAGDVAIGADLMVSAVITSSAVTVAGASEYRAVYRIYVQPPGADLYVDSNLRLVSLHAGRPAMFTATVMNVGNVQAAAAVLTITLPRGVTLKDADPKPTTSTANVATWALGDVAPGATRTHSVTVDLDSRLGIHEFSKVEALAFSLDVTAATDDQSPADNHLKIVRGVDAEGHDVAIWLNVEGGPGGEIKAGKEATAVLVYANLGRQEARDTVATLRGAPAANENADRPLGTWQLGNLPAGAQGMIRVAIPILASSETQLTALILAGGQDVNLDNNTARAFLRETRGSLKTVALKSAATDAPSKQVGWLLPAVSIAVLLLLAAVATWWVRRRKP